jgi:hypothetical protein
VRSAIAQFPDVQGIEVSVEERFVRFKYRADTLDLQRMFAAISGKDKRFEARLVLQLEDPKAGGAAFDKLRARLKAIKGVRQVSSPDSEGIVLISLVTEERTLLGDVLKAAAEVAVPLRDPVRKKPPAEKP